MPTTNWFNIKKKTTLHMNNDENYEYEHYEGWYFNNVLDILSGMQTILIIFNLVLAILFWYLRSIQSKGTNTPRTGPVLFVTAHPDDEAMFFVPSIRSLVKQGREVFLLCLSSGNYDSIGEIRKEELFNCCSQLGIIKKEERKEESSYSITKSKTKTKNTTKKVEKSHSNGNKDKNFTDVHLHIVENDSLQDGPNKDWDLEVIANIVKDMVTSHNISSILTFDGYGISGHPNHIATSKGVRKFLNGWDVKHPDHNLRIFELESLYKLRKFIGEIFAAHWAMNAHASQYVWFRRLFILFSRYSFVNTFNCINDVNE